MCLVALLLVLGAARSSAGSRWRRRYGRRFVTGRGVTTTEPAPTAPPAGTAPPDTPPTPPTFLAPATTWSSAPWLLYPVLSVLILVALIAILNSVTSRGEPSAHRITTIRHSSTPQDV